MTEAPSPPAATESATLLLAAALIGLPFLQALPIDFDRSAPLVLLAPALWSGRARLAEAVSTVASAPQWLRFSFALAALALVLAVAFANHPAPAAVMAASWVLIAAAGLMASRLIQRDPGASTRLLAGLALGAAAGTVAVWVLWSLGDRGAMPLYAHHRHLGLHALAGACATTALLVRPGLASGKQIGWMLVGAVTWGGMLWSGGRGPVLAIAGALALWFWFARPVTRRALLVWSTGQLVAGLAVSALFWTPRAELGWWHAFQRTAAATQPGGIDVSALTSTRSEFWRASAHRALRSPWIGHGPDAYRFLTPKLDGQQPHNVVLQLWLDLGAIGALPALALLGGSILAGWRRVRREPAAGHVAAWPVLITALTLAGMLDGVFYHVLTLLPAMLAVGVLLPAGMNEAAASASKWTARPPDRTHSLALAATSRGRRESSSPGNGYVVMSGLVTGAAMIVLALHTWLFHALVVATPAAAPNAIAARAVRLFPSTTFGLWRWLDEWHRTTPEVALDWARWAQAHAANPSLFHIRAAQYLQVHGDRAGALAELSAAAEKAHSLSRPAIADLRKSMLSTP